MLCGTLGKRQEVQLKSRTFASLLRDERGALMVEYIVVTAIAFGSSSAILYCAYVLAGNFAGVRNYVLFPFP